MSDINKPQLETVIDDTDDLRPADDPIMAEEQAHLDEIYTKLTAMRDGLAAELEHGHEGAAADLRELSDEIRPDFGGAADEVMETLAAIETLNAVIDAYNQYHDFSVDKLRRLLLLLRQPYFAKVRLKMSPDRPARDVYIGAVGMTDERSRPLIVDWRNPVAETYYNQENGQTSYTVNGRTRTVELELRRQFDITRDHLNMYFDTTVAIEDSLLLGALRRHHSEKLKDITATIQREQNQVVRHADVPALLVNGIAGSGKTSVMLQRIAYLLYGERETLSASQVHLFGPNAVFEHYIDNVLPSMGESNPQVYTWRDFCEAQGAGGRDLGEDTDPACLEKLESDISSLFLTADDLREISCDGTVLLKLASVESAVAKFARFGVGPRFCALVTDELHDRVSRRIALMARDEELQEEMLGLDVDDQVRFFGETVSPENEQETVALTRRWLEQVFAGAHDEVDRLAWLKLDRVAMRMLGKPSVSASEWLYLRLLVTGRGDTDARYVMIDEVQDCTVAQLMVLSRHFSRAHFLMLGDEHQAIREGTASFAQIRELFGRTHGQVDECRLLTSYRSSPEITTLFSGLVEHDAPVKLASVHRAGVAPHIEAVPGRDEFLAALRKQVAAAHEMEGLTALVAADDGAVSWLAKQLRDCDVTVIKNNNELPAAGVVLMSLRLAKGLEFDQVIIPDASAEAYPDTPLARRRLYTAVSRAMHGVTLLAQGELTPLVTR
ncbi:ATP-binding domain-containing protein [uncultured Parolsenella sp.]|uniref:HelD family protein n=1 Tax=uncultured Parolsenella sp. TaxID=2083008 RepID=UPI0025F4CB59|nr:ATP-binding domain-containing protein [uncultured Parolsenella sp.]